jgi:hypothetical protein
MYQSWDEIVKLINWLMKIKDFAFSHIDVNPSFSRRAKSFNRINMIISVLIGRSSVCCV